MNKYTEAVSVCLYCKKESAKVDAHITDNGEFCDAGHEIDYMLSCSQEEYLDEEEYPDEEESSGWKQWLFIALALAFLLTFFLYFQSSEASTDESIDDEDVLVIGQTRLLMGNVRACWNEQFTIGAMKYIETMPFSVWSFRFDKLVAENVCGKGKIVVTLVERFDTIYTDSDGDEWRIIKAIPIDFQMEGEEKHVFLLLLNQVMTQEEYEDYLLLINKLMSQEEYENYILLQSI